jgi:polyisoprenoid-binding protein YceI
VAAPIYPELTFKSIGVEPAGSDRLRVVGQLTIKGVTRDVALDVEHHGLARERTNVTITPETRRRESVRQLLRHD